MITKNHPGLSISEQCRLLSISRSSFYYTPKGETALRGISGKQVGKFQNKRLLPYLRRVLFAPIE